MTRWLPFPLMSAAVLATWLLLNQSLSPGHLLFGAILALAGGFALTAVQAPSGRVRRPLVIARLFGLVLADIVRSNIAVGRIILSPRPRRRTAGFMQIPLELRDPYGLAVLACIITSTPGTIWVNFDSSRGLLMIHVLDLTDESAWIATIKGRYERLLLEIFA